MGKTYLDKIKSIVSGDIDLCAETPQNWEKLVALAYYYGRESATREISDKYVNKLQTIKRRANNCRYHNMATAIVGDCNYIYSPDYSGDMTGMFGGDIWEGDAK